MKDLKYIFLLLFFLFSTDSFPQYKGGSYDGYYSQLDTNIFDPVGIENLSEVVNDFQLFQNYPNPFNPSTVINYRLNSESFVSVKIFDLTGKEVVTLINEKQNPGSYNVEFDAKDFPAGVYFYRLAANKFSVTKKMILIK